MKTDVIRIGNSKGVRLPATMLKQCGITSKVEIELRENEIVLRPVPSPREGWEESFCQMHSQGDDALIIPGELDDEIMEAWDEN